MSNPSEHHHSRLYCFFASRPIEINSLNNGSTPANTQPSHSASSIAIASVQDCYRLCCQTPASPVSSEATPPPSQSVWCKWSTCRESFTRPEDLAPHLFQDHVNKTRKKNPRCYWESCSETVEDLLKHLTSHHLIRLWLACRWKDCSKSFGGFRGLTDHVSEDHVGSRKSKYECYWTPCDRRGRVFNQRQKIMRHIQTHTGAKPYQCEICQKRFSESTVMTQHMRVHTGEKPYRCTECNKQFTVSASLIIHKRVHTGEKPFVCTFQDCNKRFIESSNLTKHIRVHTGERPFKCTVNSCEKAFSRPDQVTRHLKTHKNLQISK